MTFFELSIVVGCLLSIGLACFGALLAEFQERPLSDRGPDLNDGGSMVAAAAVTTAATAPPLAPSVTRGELKKALIHSLDSDDFEESEKLFKQFLESPREGHEATAPARRRNVS